MKSIIPIIICILFTSIAKSQSNEPIFTIVQDTIKNNNKFIEPFFFEDENAIPYLFKVFPIKSKTGKHQYSIKLSNYKGSENDGGFFRIIEISTNNETILKIRQSDGWNSLPRNIIKYSNNHYFLTLHLTDETTALIFCGYPYNSEPELMTIIILHKNTAKLIFNKKFIINKLEHSEETFSLTLHDSVIEYIGDQNANTTKIYKIWQENNILKIGGPYGTAKNNFD